MAPLKPEYIETLPLPKVEAQPLAYHQNLVAALQGKAEPQVSWEDMRRDMKVVDLAFASSLRNEVIKTII